MSQLHVNTNLFFSSNRYEELFVLLNNNLSINHVVFIIDSSLSEHSVISEVLQLFQRKKYQVSCVNYYSKGEPTYSDLDSFVAELKYDQVDLIVAFGGGATIDIAKGVGVLLTNPGKAIDYRGMNKVSNPGIPVVAFPSTAGTGTEVTWTASLIDDVSGRKLGINGKHVAPYCGVLEPRLVASAPYSVALSAGLDAMVHAVEAVTARNATTFTISLGAQAFAQLYEFLPAAINDVHNLPAWEEVQMAAYLAGLAMMNAGGGPASGISYPLGVHYKVPHGFAGGVFLSGVFAINIAKGYTGYSSIYRLLPGANLQLSLEEQMQDFLIMFNKFYDVVGGHRSLRQWNCIGSDAVKKLTDLTLDERVENLRLNPISFEKDDLEKLLMTVCV